jgi:two-component system cell cycle sensor histidine kinase/response regulator CckA
MDDVHRPPSRPLGEVSAEALERLTLIAQLTSPVLGAAALRAQVSSLLEQVQSAYDVDACVVRTLEDGQLELLAAVGVPHSQLAERHPAGVGIARRMIEERRPLAIEHVEAESATAPLAIAARGDPSKFQFVAYAGAPLLLETRVIGIIGVYSRHASRRFTDSELSHLQIVANHIASAIVNDRLYRELSDSRSALQREIHERERAESRRAAAEEQLRHAQRMESLGQLAGGVAHDFNNLLTVILGSTELLGRDQRHGDSKSRATIERIEGAARRANNLTKQLLAFSRKQPNNPTVFDLNALLRDLYEMLRRLVEADIDLVVQGCEAPCLVRADPGQIEQVVINLVVNARDAVTRGGRIEIACGRDAPAAETDAAPARAVLTVRDNGCGMDAATTKRVFEPFFTTKRPGAGTGLGLSTAYGIVKQAAGDISVASAAGVGTTFTVALPLQDRGPTATATRGTPVSRSRGGEAVLVCEDEADVREVIRLALTSAGYEVHTARDAQEALLRVNHEALELDLLITDAVMPGMTGRQLADELRNRHPELRCIIISGYLGKVLDGAVETDATVRVLAKPFGPRELLACVREVLNGIAE